jgi:phosphate transport system substrate-binding protein
MRRPFRHGDTIQMRKFFSAFAGLMAAAAPLLAQVQVDTQIPPYRAMQGVSGNIKSIGSDTMNNLMTLWAEEFNKFYPNVKVEIEGKGSSTAPAALIEGQAQFGPMSRPMKASEVDEFEKKFGYKPTPLRAGIDTLAIYVHKDCPLNEITLDQIQRVFSVAGPEVTWDQLGIADAAYRGKTVSLYGRNSASGTYGYFKEVALGGRDYKATVKEQPGSSAVVQGIASDRFAMGYSGLGYKTAGVKALKVSAARGEEAFEATVDNAISGEYPIARFLYIYINHDPRRPMEPLRAEFIRMMFSRAGQESVVKDGYFPVNADIAREELVKVGIKPDF